MRMMSSGKKRLAIGMEDFAEVRRLGCYYVDKTRLIANLLYSPAKVTLFTRPRRFGKTLNMSMLKCFFEIGGDPALFEGLAVSAEREICERYMGKFPVISISLKDVVGGSGKQGYRLARDLMCDTIGTEASRFYFLLDSERLNADEKERYRNLIRVDGISGGQYSMTDAVLAGSLRTLSALLEKHFGRKVILLIDEYDVPLQKAFYGGYYDEMVQLIRGVFSQALKTNPSLEFAVLTGCLRISKESIFTGMNRVSMQENPPVTGSLYNLRVMTVTHEEFADCFGFTDRDVQELLAYYGLTSCYGTVKEWYDGYRFGNAEVYCPWDVINYASRLLINLKAQPENYWANSSGNDVVRSFVQKLDMGVASGEMEALVAGDAVMKEIRQELTYREMYDSVENIWSLLYMTGYLTKHGEPEGKKLPLVIPNMEIRDIFTTQIMDMFKERVSQDGVMVREFCGALLAGDAGKAEALLEKYLSMTVSVRDTFVRRNLKENFYHGILLGILGYKGDWYVTSNYETGDGYGDILIEPKEGSPGIIIEVKYAHDGDLEKGAGLALEQIDDYSGAH